VGCAPLPHNIDPFYGKPPHPVLCPTQLQTIDAQTIIIGQAVKAMK